MKDKKAYAGIVITGAVIGLIAVALVLLGNPKNMGFCIACFLRDIAGATKLHTTGTVQYFRPEIVGLVGGAPAMALIGKEFSPKGGSAPVTRFFLGAFVMIGALVFLGCPLRMVLRIGGGDLNAVVGLVGFACGILGGIFFLNKGFSLKRTYKMTTSEAVTLPIGLALLFVLVLLVPSLFAASEEGPGSMPPPIIIALIAGLVVGALCQKSRMCMVAGIPDLVLEIIARICYNYCCCSDRQPGHRQLQPRFLRPADRALRTSLELHGHAGCRSRLGPAGRLPAQTAHPDRRGQHRLGCHRAGLHCRRSFCAQLWPCRRRCHR